MNCPNCGARARVKKVDLFPYDGAGVSGVFLQGAEVVTCKKCGETTPVLTNVIGMFAKLGELIALKPQPLTGEEARFLRKHAGCSGREWARLLGIEPSALSRWENGKNIIGPQSDRLMRLIYLWMLMEQAEWIDKTRILMCISEIEKRNIDSENHHLVIDVALVGARFTGNHVGDLAHC